MELTKDQRAAIDKVQADYQADVQAAEAEYRSTIAPFEAAIAEARARLREFTVARIEQTKAKKKALFESFKKA